MRWVFLWFLLLIGALSQPMLAEGQPFVRTIAKHVPMDIYEVVNYTLQCPPGYVPIGYSLTPQYTYDDDEDQGRNLIDRNGATIDRNALSSAAQLDGGGYALQVFNLEHHAKEMQAMAICLATSASSDNTLQLVKSTGNIAKQTTGTVTTFCPSDSPVAFGGFSNADGRLLQDDGSGPVWGTGGSPTYLNDVPDGTTMGPPSGWQVRVFNNLATNPQVLGFAYCGKGPSVQTYVYSVPVLPSSFGFPTPFSIFAPVPNGWTAVGAGYDGGQYGRYSNSDLWIQDGTVVDVLQWYAGSTGYDSGSAEVRAFMVRGGGTGPGGVPAQAAVAVLAIPQTGVQPASTTVNIVEFYNAGLDHYFITAIPDEIAKLDNGTFRGWTRTGQTFKGYGAGSAGGISRRPVCREYGRPDFGLDSHFYSADPDECMASMANTLGAWGLEASDVFEMDLPNPTTGACPADGVPIYRIWNQRRDSNHRYTTSIATRDQMIAKGGFPEGYGPQNVALCGLQ